MQMSQVVLSAQKAKDELSRIPELFGSMVFNDHVMKERLPKDTYRALRKTIELGKSLDKSIANVVANAMKDWAVEKGATHFTHWLDVYKRQLPGGTEQKTPAYSGS